MAGRHRRRRRGGHLRQERSPLAPPPGDPSPMEPTTRREVAIPDRPSKKTCHASSSTSSSMSGPDVWAGLLDSLLLQIIALLSSFHDLLALIGTCHSWRAALSSLPPAFSFNFPPLHLQPDDPHPHRNYVKHSLLSNIKWQLVDPAKQTSSLRSSAPQNLRVRMRYLGCSYGYLIFYNFEQCLLVDVYSGATKKPPKLKSTGNHDIYYGFLVAPINSSNLHLLFFSKSSMFQWQVGSNSWSEHPLDVERILQIVFFKGEMFAMDLFGRLHRIRLAPQFSMQEIAVMWGEDMDAGLSCQQWLVACGDMLLLVDFSVSFEPFSDLPGTFKVFCLDFSVEPAKWVKMDNLGDNALFVSTDRRSPTFSCMSPERWGGKRNSIYVTNPSADCNEPWIAVELGQVVPSTTYSPEPILARGPGVRYHQPQSLWVLPSLVYGVGR
ncbi:F-box protein At2g26160 isoform X1 [Setaria italica]|nr:F-box protein At2g26160 isoform X1 [Setaria italica]